MKYQFSFWQHHPISDQNAELLAQETIEWYHNYQPDFLKITPAGSWQATCYGLTDAWENDFLGRRTIQNRIIKNIEDWDKIHLWSTPPFPLQIQVKAAKLVCDEIQEVPVFATVFNPITQVIQLAGLDVLKNHLAQNSAKVLQALDIITSNTLKTIDLFIQSGIKGLYFVTQAQQNSIFTFQEYQKYALANDTICLQHSAKYLNDIIFHLHGDEIYACVQDIPKVKIHFEEHPNWQLNTHFCNLPKIVGVPAKTIRSIQDKNEILKYIQQSKQTIITCGCVIPLDFKIIELQNWINVIKKI